MKPRPLALTAGLIFAAAFVAACATTNTGAFAVHGFDFWTVRTFEWAPAEHLATGDPRLDNNEFFQRYVKAAVERELGIKGLERVEAGTADVIVHYHASVTQRVDAGGLDLDRYGTCEDCRPSVFDAGTLTIDLVDAGSNRVIWRGWSERSIEGIVERQEWMEREVNTAVAKILERFPVRLIALR